MKRENRKGEISFKMAFLLGGIMISQCFFG